VSSSRGFTAPGFEGVERRFDDVLRQSSPGGAALHVRVGGRTVIDRWGGAAGSERPWRSETTSVLFSCSKGVLAVLTGILAQEGAIALDAPVADYWPELRVARDGRLTVRGLLAHRAGLPVVRADLTRDDVVGWERMTAILAREDPLFAPGSAHQYHALTVGWLIGEVLLRASGRRVEHLLAERIAEPLGVPLWFGAPEEALPSLGELVVLDDYPPSTGAPTTGRSDLERLSHRGLTLGSALPERFAAPGVGFNDPVVHRAVIPGAGAVGSARALATMWSATVCEEERVRLLDRSTVEDLCRPVSEGPPVLAAEGPQHRWGAGVMLSSESRPLLSPRSFGHDGLGGQLAFADPAAGLGFAFITTGLRLAADDRAQKLVTAVQAALECRVRATR
jgi:CubicO group peptidase (beta-lactamase class C family)